MAKSSTRRVTIYINGKEVEASVKQIRSEMNKLVNEQNRMVIGSDEYIAHAKKIKELRQYLKEHAQNIGSAASAWSEMYNKVLQFGTGIGGLTQILSSLDNVTSTLKQVATDLAAMDDLGIFPRNDFFLRQTWRSDRKYSYFCTSIREPNIHL